MKVNKNNYHLSNPPGCIKINPNFYCDETEITNFKWMEYMFWNSKIFGSTSNEYLASLPDTSVWSKLDSCNCLNDYSVFYLRHPAYRKFPVVGITQQQAIDYTNWRSDRVFEYYLVKLKIIEYDPKQTRKTHFTIDKYFKDSLTTNNSVRKIEYYPCYKLPNIRERNVLLRYNDSIFDVFSNTFNQECKNCKNRIKHGQLIQSDIIPCKKNKIYMFPLLAMYPSGKYIQNLRGNVAEWTSERFIVAGGGWKDSRENIFQTDTSTFFQTNAWIGFRNVCEWKKWN